ncbi:MAG TPA: alpha/beta fold hydrolase [Solirubrobacteraceae bacterium]|nr:alpha/beta fold hydrolase [Solirubrobacteraceae bacterium]
MRRSPLAKAAGLAFREAGEAGSPAALLVHGYPSSSYMWEPLLGELAARGFHAVAPDLAGFGDSEPDPPGTWERHTESLERFRAELGLERPALVTHDWGVMIGLRWACDHPDAVRALVISDGGFFSDRRWHDLANAMRTEGQGEQLVESITREAFDATMHQGSAGMTDEAIAEYWKCFADPVRRRGHLELYRSGDFEKLVPYEGCLAALEVPALIVWGEGDRYASPRMAHRFAEEIRDSELVVFAGAGHFVWEDEPERASGAAAEFLARRLLHENRTHG